MRIITADETLAPLRRHEIRNRNILPGEQKNQPLCHNIKQTSRYTFYKYQRFLKYNVISIFN